MGRTLRAEDHGGAGVFGLGGVDEGNGDQDTKLAFGVPAVDTSSGGHVRIIAANGNTDVPFAAKKIVGGIEFHPAGFAQIGFHPCMGSSRGRAIMAFTLVIEIATDVAARNVELADEGDHDVGKILAYTLVSLQSIVDGRIDPRGIGSVVEILVNRGVQFFQESEGFTAAFKVEFMA